MGSWWSTKLDPVVTYRASEYREIRRTLRQWSRLSDRRRQNAEDRLVELGYLSLGTSLTDAKKALADLHRRTRKGIVAVEHDRTLFQKLMDL